MNKGEFPESVVAQLLSLKIELEMETRGTKTDTESHCELFVILSEECRNEIKEH